MSISNVAAAGGFYPRDWTRQPPALTPGYKTTVLRSPEYPLLSLENTISEMTGPAFGQRDIGRFDSDLLQNHADGGEAIGERIIVHGRVLDENARPVPGALVELWQANAGGRYRHVVDGYLAPLDPNFGGCGRAITDAQGRYRFRSVKPGAYPWRNSANSWRPPHIHFSVFGSAFAQRLITQMYFEGDPLIPLCAILNTIPDASAREALIAPLDMNAAVPLDCLAWKFDIVLRGSRQTPFENRLEGG